MGEVWDGITWFLGLHQIFPLHDLFLKRVIDTTGSDIKYQNLWSRFLFLSIVSDEKQGIGDLGSSLKFSLSRTCFPFERKWKSQGKAAPEERLLKYMTHPLPLNHILLARQVKPTFIPPLVLVSRAIEPKSISSPKIKNITILTSKRYLSAVSLRGRLRREEVGSKVEFQRRIGGVVRKISMDQGAAEVGGIRDGKNGEGRMKGGLKFVDVSSRGFFWPFLFSYCFPCFSLFLFIPVFDFHVANSKSNKSCLYASWLRLLLSNQGDDWAERWFEK